jgi:hypothetical protein
MRKTFQTSKNKFAWIHWICDTHIWYVRGKSATEYWYFKDFKGQAALDYFLISGLYS